jgi:hypothetical protein
MNISLKQIAIFILICLLVGCAERHTSYSPLPIGSAQEVQLRLEQLLREQESSYQLLDCEVARDYFKCNYAYTQGYRSGITTVPYAQFVYFKSIRKVQLYSKRSYWTVYLGNAAGSEIFAYQTNDEEKAKAFVDIVIGLSGLDASVLSKPW